MASAVIEVVGWGVEFEVLDYFKLVASVRLGIASEPTARLRSRLSHSRLRFFNIKHRDLPTMTRSGESGTIYKTDLTWVSAATVIGNQDPPEIGTANPGTIKP